ncbi:radical SAM protein, partial [Candidatus Bathyarchaeota archaeon]
EGLSRYELMSFDAGGRIVDFGLAGGELVEVASSGLPFMTSGCPDCNRPYYNEPVRGPLYNYPFRPGEEDVRAILAQLGLA